MGHASHLSLAGPRGAGLLARLGRTPRPDRLNERGMLSCPMGERSPTEARGGGVKSAISAVLRRGEEDDGESPSNRYRQGFRLKNWPFSTTLQLDDHGATPLASLWRSSRGDSGVSRQSNLWLHRVRHQAQRLRSKDLQRSDL